MGEAIMADGVDWDVEDFEQQLRLRMAELLARAAVHVVTAHQKNLSVANPAPHTAPAPRGQFPRGRTFFLRANVGFEPQSVAAIARVGRVTVGVHEPAAYGLFLQRKGWLGLSDTVAREQPALNKIFGSV